MKQQKKIICHLSKIHKKMTPLLPWEQIEKTTSQTELINRAKNENFNWLISSLGENNYYQNFDILEATRNISTKRILYTEKKYNSSLKNIVEGFDAFLINHWELPTLNGLINSQASLKKEGKILIYFKSYAEQLIVFNGHQEREIENNYHDVVINNYSSDELTDILKANFFKVIIDTTTAIYPWYKQSKTTSVIIEKFKITPFTEIPLLVCLKNQLTLKRDVIKNINYYSQPSKV